MATNFISSSFKDKEWNSQQPTANSQQPTANSQQPTANSQQPTANSQQQQATDALTTQAISDDAMLKLTPKAAKPHTISPAINLPDAYLAVQVQPHSPNAPLTPLLEHNSHEKYSPASCLKLMTILVAYESGLDFSTLVAITDADLVDGSGNNLKADDILTLEDLVYNALLSSSNTATNAISRIVGKYLGGDQHTFFTAMNQKARSLGARTTNIKNAHGLVAYKQFTTAHDLMLIAVAFAKIEALQKYWCVKKHTINVLGIQARQIVLESTAGELLTNTPWYLGAKTGSVGTLANQVTKIDLFDGTFAILVTMKHSSRKTRATEVRTLAKQVLYKHCFSE